MRRHVRRRVAPHTGLGWTEKPPERAPPARCSPSPRHRSHSPLALVHARVLERERVRVRLR